MIIIEKAKGTNGVLLKGDFFDFDRLYFAIMKYTGSHGMYDSCPFPGCYDACENLLGLGYELRHAWQGDRNIEQVYNGIRDEWFDDYEESDSEPYEDDEDDYEDESDDDYGNGFQFARSSFPDANDKNTYFSIQLTFPEAIFYALIISDLLGKKEMFMEAKKLLAEEAGDLQQIHREYYFFQAEEDIARLTLYAKQTLHVLYRFVGEDMYMPFVNKFKKINNFSAKCNLDKINDLLVYYGEKEYSQDNPDILMPLLISFLE